MQKYSENLILFFNNVYSFRICLFGNVVPCIQWNIWMGKKINFYQKSYQNSIENRFYQMNKIISPLKIPRRLNNREATCQQDKAL